MAARFLQDQSFFAVAQKKYVFIYDRNGVELHRLKSHIEPTRLEFLPYHWLLASVVSTLVTTSVPIQTSFALTGKPWVPEIPRHVHRYARGRTPDESGRLPYHDSKSTQRHHPSRSPKRRRVVVDSEPTSSRSPAARACRSRRGSERRS